MAFNKILNLIKKAKHKNIVLLLSLIYNFVWAACKIIFGFINFSYFFCVSGISTLLFGFMKKIYLKNFNIDNFYERKKKSISISILLIVSSSLFTFYMARLFFIPTISNYGLITSITIAAFSFTELGLSLHNFLKSKKSNDPLLQSIKSCSLASSCFAITLTQVSLLSATNTSNNFYNGLTGVIFGIFAILIGIYSLVKSKTAKDNCNFS